MENLYTNLFNGLRLRYFVSTLFAMFTIMGIGHSQIMVRDTFLSNDTYTVPSDVTSITVQAWGGGGGGGRGFSRANSAAGGGGGAFAQSVLAVAPGQMFAVIVGVGGTGGTQSLAGTNGTGSNFGGGTVVAPGGFAPIDLIAGQFGSNPGVGGPVGTGDISFAGGNGAPKFTNFIGGGAGSSGGTGGTGNNAVGQSGGVAPADGGDGGDGGDNTQPGEQGFVPGGGGGGKGGGQNVASGNGGSGMIIVIYEIPEIELDCPMDYVADPCETQEDIDIAYEAWIESFSFTGGCGTPTESFDGGIPDAPLECGGSVSVTYRVASDCEDDQVCTSTFTVTDAPLLTVTCPADYDATTCEDQSPINAAFAVWRSGFSNDGGCNAVATDVSGYGPPTFCGGSVEITYTATDDCGQIASCSSVFTVPSAPAVVLTCPGDEVVASCQTQGAIDTAFTAWLLEVSSSGGCNSVLTNDNTGAPDACGGSTTVTWTVASSCEDDVECSATFTVTDAPLVELTCPDDEVVASCQTQGAIDTAFTAWLLEVSSSGGCNSVLTNDNTGAPDACGGSTTVTWTVASSCEDDVECSATFSVTAPETVVIACPGNQAEEACQTQEDIDAAFALWLEGASSTGGCDVEITDNSVDAPNYCGGSVTITFTATDAACGGTDVCEATFSVGAPETVEITCPEPYLAEECQTQEAIDAAFATWLTEVSAIGGCDVVITNDSDGAPDACGGSVTVTFTATDLECGGIDECSETFTVPFAPELTVTCPADYLAEACPEPEALDIAFEDWIAGFDADGGCGTTTTDLSGYSTPSFCGGNVTIVFEAADNCDQIASCTSSFVVPEAAPVVITCPEPALIDACETQEDVNLSFEAWIDEFGFDGGCNAQGSDLSGFEAPSFCGGSVTILYTVSSDCADDEVCSSVFTVENRPDLIVVCPEDFNAEACQTQEDIDSEFDNWISLFEAEGGCFTTTTDLDVYTAPDACGGSVTVLFEASDECGQSTNCSAVFTVADAPELIVTCSDDVTLDACTSQEDINDEYNNWLNGFYYEGGCNAQQGYNVLQNGSSQNGFSDWTIISQSGDGWDATGLEFLTSYGDCPELTSTHRMSQLVDLVAAGYSEAFLDGAPSIAIGETVRSLALNALCAPAEATDNYHVRYELRDASQSVIASFLIGSPAAPAQIGLTPEQISHVFSAYGPGVRYVYFEHGGSDKGYWAGHYGAAFGNAFVSLENPPTTAPDACGGSVSVTYVVTSDCEEDHVCTRTFTVAPVTGLDWDNEMPANAAAECDNVPEVPIVTASNDCGDVAVLFEESIEDGSCAGNYTITRTWTAVDECGNEITHTQTITVTDTQAPVLEGTLPGGVLENVMKDDAPPAPDEEDIAALYSDNCSGVIAVLIDTQMEGTDCNWTVTYTYSVTDGCGNEADNAVVIYEGVDTIDPIVTCSEDIEVILPEGECEAEVAVTEPDVDDACPTELTYERSDALDLEDPYSVGVTTIIWTATDEAGNTGTCVQTVTVMEPQRILVSGLGVEIINGTTSTSFTDGTKFGSVSLGGMITRTFTIENVGCVDLDLTGEPIVVIEGDDPSFFTVILQPAVTTLAPGESVDFQVKYTGTAYGAHNAIVRIDNNDVLNDPFTFAISAATSPAVMVITGNNINIPNGDMTPQSADFTDYGVIAFNGTRTRTFRVLNIGASTLFLTGTPRVALSGPGASKFTVTTQPQASVGPGSNRLFQIRFDANEVGEFVATVTIENSDLGNNPYTFDIKATVLAPSMEVRGNNILIVNGDVTPEVPDNTDFGHRIVGSSRNHTFTVYNGGPGHLFLSGSPRVVLSGANADQFSVTLQPVSLVSPNNSSLYRITYSPTGVGVHFATVTIASNDLVNNPYIYDIRGEASNAFKGGISGLANVDGTNAGNADIRMTSYPNPVREQLFIDAPLRDEAYRLEVLNLSGHVQHSIQTVGGRIEMNTSNLTPGMYILRAIGIEVDPIRFIRIE